MEYNSQHPNCVEDDGEGEYDDYPDDDEGSYEGGRQTYIDVTETIVNRLIFEESDYYVPSSSHFYKTTDGRYVLALQSHSMAERFQRLQIELSGPLCIGVCEAVLSKSEGLDRLLEIVFLTHPRTHQLHPDDVIYYCMQNQLLKPTASTFTYNVQIIILEKPHHMTGGKRKHKMHSSESIYLSDANLHFLIAFCDHCGYETIVNVWTYKLDGKDVLKELSWYQRDEEESQVKYHFKCGDCYYPHECLEGQSILSKTIPLHFNTKLLEGVRYTNWRRPSGPQPIDLKMFAACGGRIVR